MSDYKHTVKVGHDLYDCNKRYVVCWTESYNDRDGELVLKVRAIPYERCNPIVESHTKKPKAKKK